MPIGNNILSGASGQTTGYEIEQSLRFEDGDSAYLTRQYSSAGNRKTYTLSCWVKRGALGDKRIFGADGSSNFAWVLQFDSSDRISVGAYSGGYVYQVVTTSVYRDVGAWYHIVVSTDTTQATASDRIKIYVNGEQVTAFDTSSYPSLNLDTSINDNTASRPHGIGYIPGSGGDYDGYLAEVIFLDGIAASPSDLGETNSDTNQWVPLEYVGSYGTNGFYLKFQDSSALGDDSSGNTNDFTPTNLAATDQVLDSPTNNFATLNPLLGSTIDRFTLKEGNLEGTTNGSDWNVMVGNMALPDSGKWYWETSTNNNNAYTGIVDESEDLTVTNPTGGVVYYLGDGRKRIDGTFSSYGAAASGGDIIGVAVDMDASPRTIEFYKNNVSQGSITITGSCATDTVFPYLTTLSTTHLNFGADSSFANYKTAQGNTDGNGKGDFYYPPPTSYLALCSDNLSDPSIADPTKHFNTVLYTGNGGTNSITGTNFSPDLVWNKARDGGSGHDIYDSVRGVEKSLASDETSAEVNRSTGLQSFDSDGFTTGDYIRSNFSGRIFVSWNWKAGGTASSNTDGSITSSVSANTDAGFSIVSFTGNGTAGATVGHGLSQAPEFWVTKNRDSAYAWFTGTPEYPNPAGNYYIQLDATQAASSNTGIWNGTLASSSVITLGNLASAQNNSGDAHIAYCFHSVDGYSKVGSYTGNGSTDGTFIYTGFRPAFVLLKISSASNDWILQDNKRDTYNAVGHYLRPNTSDAELDEDSIDFLSNGFKLRTTSGARNTSSGTYIYLAFAESPFKYSNAR